MTTATRRAQLCESMQGAVHAAFQIADFSYARKKNTCHAVAIAIAIAIASLQLRTAECRARYTMA